MTFDASAGYLAHNEAAERIYAYNPNVKIIILLRNPIERAYSAWNMYKERYLKNRNWFFDDWDCYRFTFLRRKDSHIFNFLQYAVDEIELRNESAALEAPILFHGHYYDQIQRYLAFFDRRQLLIIEHTEMYMDTIKSLQKIEEFLEIPNCNWKDINLSPIFEGEYLEQITEDASRFLCDYYALSNEKLFNLLGKSYPWDVKKL